jgi:hypothetical protein
MAAAAAVMAAAFVLVIALAFALYAAMRDVAGMSPEAAAAVVALVAALLITIPALILAIKLATRRRRERTLVERVKGFVAERPLAAAAAALAAGVFAVRSPKAMVDVLLAVLEPRGGRRY